jgi:hypothetical protein
MVPEMLLGAVSGAEIVAGGLLRFSRAILLSTVSGAADIGVEAISAGATGARGMVSAASRMVSDIATAAQSSFQEAVATARQSGARDARGRSRRALATMAGRPAESSETASNGRRGRTSTEQVIAGDTAAA